LEAAVVEQVEQVEREDVRVLVIGTGFAGIAMAVALREQGEDGQGVVLLERGEEVGGTWRDNTYPGAACDVPSQLYSLSFAPNPRWSHSFSRQPEIQDYLVRTAREHGVSAMTRFGTEVTGAQWDPQAQRWLVDAVHDGRPVGLRAQFLISAVGALSDPAYPRVDGLESFRGSMFHSSRWDHDHDLTGERVAVIGTGASAIQFVPQVQRVAGHLTVFQRTPPWVMPRTDRPLRAVEHAAYSRFPAVQRLARQAIYWGRETYAVGFTRRPGVLKVAERIASWHLHRQVRDPALRAQLTPDYAIGCKRILISNDYYPALTQPNVSVQTAAIRAVTPTGITTVDGVHHEVDTIVVGTGFQVTDMPMARWLRDGAGRTLAELWAGRMRSHLGTTVAGLPNLFLLVGPNTGLGHSSQVFMIEQQVGYVAQAIAATAAREAATVEVREDVLAAYDAELVWRMARTVWATGGCRSWYLDAEGHNTTLWPDFTFRFRSRLARFRPEEHVFAPAVVRPVTVGV